MKSIAIYRLPNAASCCVIGDNSCALSLDSYLQLSDAKGYVIAPFSSTDDCKILVIRPEFKREFDAVEDMPEEVIGMINAVCESNYRGAYFQQSSKEDYEKDFQKFHSKIEEGEFEKLVLSRSRVCEMPSSHPFVAFANACHKYPNAFVSLFSTPQSGTWLTASPEALIESDNGLWRTMALAGTMPADSGEWSEKDKREQNLVECYIKDVLQSVSDTITVSQPHTVRAGNIQHICTDFAFNLPSGNVGELLSRLHPTPATCGLPKDKAKEFIERNESNRREYFSGFSGPIEKGELHLYVTLRCLQFIKNGAILYAGSGIMPQSTCADEWQETSQKMKIIESVI